MSHREWDNAGESWLVTRRFVLRCLEQGERVICYGICLLRDLFIAGFVCYGICLLRGLFVTRYFVCHGICLIDLFASGVEGWRRGGPLCPGL